MREQDPRRAQGRVVHPPLLRRRQRARRPRPVVRPLARRRPRDPRHHRDGPGLLARRRQGDRGAAALGQVDAALVDHERLSCVLLSLSPLSSPSKICRRAEPDLLAASLADKLLMCHRVFLGRSFRDSRFAFSRKAAIEAARSIIQELVKGSHLPYQHLWTVRCCSSSRSPLSPLKGLDLTRTPCSTGPLPHNLCSNLPRPRYLPDVVGRPRPRPQAPRGPSGARRAARPLGRGQQPDRGARDPAPHDAPRRGAAAPPAAQAQGGRARQRRRRRARPLEREPGQTRRVHVGQPHAARHAGEPRCFCAAAASCTSSTAARAGAGAAAALDPLALPLLRSDLGARLSSRRSAARHRLVVGARCYVAARVARLGHEPDAGRIRVAPEQPRRVVGWRRWRRRRGGRSVRPGCRRAVRRAAASWSVRASGRSRSRGSERRLRAGRARSHGRLLAHARRRLVPRRRRELPRAPCADAGWAGRDAGSAGARHVVISLFSSSSLSSL